MNKEEFKECSVVAYPRQIKFLHINGGAISYYVDRHVSDYVDRLQKENQELKKQLYEASIQIQELTEQDMWCPSNCEKLDKLQQENKQLKDNWIKLKEYIRKNIIYDDVGMKILDSSPLEDYMQELEQGSDNK